MNARELMKSPVISVAPSTPVHEIAELLLEHHIGGVPVLENDRVVGLVNEYELLRRCEIGTERSAPPAPWWAPLRGHASAPIDYVKSHAQHAQDIMTHEVTTVSEDTPVQEIAVAFTARKVRRIMVLREAQLVGILTRADLVEALARQSADEPAAASHADEWIETRLLAELDRQSWWRSSQSTLMVHKGVVEFSGLIESEDERHAARVAAENVPGVRAVNDNRVLWTTWAMMN